MRIIDADYVTEKLNEINGTAELDKAFEVVENAPTVCDIEQIRQEIEQIPIPFDDRDSAVVQDVENMIKDRVLQIIDKYTKGVN